MKKFIIFSSVFFLPVGTTLYMMKDDIFKKLPFNFLKNKQNIEKDETRFNTNYYGLNWGSRTDEIVRLYLY